MLCISLCLTGDFVTHPVYLLSLTPTVRQCSRAPVLVDTRACYTAPKRGCGGGFRATRKTLPRKSVGLLVIDF
jgi:hypothetical protein